MYSSEQGTKIDRLAIIDINSLNLSLSASFSIQSTKIIGNIKYEPMRLSSKCTKIVLLVVGKQI